MRLFLVELRRFWGRRITWLTMLIVGLCMILGVGIAFTQTSADEPTGAVRTIFDPECTRDLIAQRDAGDEFFADYTDEEIEEQFCTFTESDGDRRFFATSLVGFSNVEDWSEFRSVEEPRGTVVVAGESYEGLRFGLDGMVPGIAIFLLVMAVVLGGSFVGAEYRSGTVENLLLWEPRRWRVIVTKYAAGFVSSALVKMLVMVFFSLLLLLLAQFRGTYQGVDGRFWVDLGLVIARAALMSGCFFILAMAIATLAKNTTAAVVALLGWFVVSNILIELLARQVRQFELFSNAGAFVTLGDVGRYVGSGDQRQLVLSHGPWVAGLVVAIWAAIPGLIALLVFRRRDIS